MVTGKDLHHLEAKYIARTTLDPEVYHALFPKYQRPLVLKLVNGVLKYASSKDKKAISKWLISDIEFPYNETMAKEIVSDYYNEINYTGRSYQITEEYYRSIREDLYKIWHNKAFWQNFLGLIKQIGLTINLGAFYRLLRLYKYIHKEAKIKQVYTKGEKYIKVGINRSGDDVYLFNIHKLHELLTEIGIYTSEKEEPVKLELLSIEQLLSKFLNYNADSSGKDRLVRSFYTILKNWDIMDRDSDRPMLSVWALEEKFGDNVKGKSRKKPLFSYKLINYLLEEACWDDSDLYYLLDLVIGKSNSKEAAQELLSKFGSKEMRVKVNNYLVEKGLM